LAALKQSSVVRPPFRICALSILLCNFQLQFLRLFLSEESCNFPLKFGNTGTFLKDLETLAFKVVLTTQISTAGETTHFAAQRINEQPVCIRGKPARLNCKNLADLLRSEPAILPTQSATRAGFESLITRLDVKPCIVANFEDTAMVRLCALSVLQGMQPMEWPPLTLE